MNTPSIVKNARFARLPSGQRARRLRSKPRVPATFVESRLPDDPPTIASCRHCAPKVRGRHTCLGEPRPRIVVLTGHFLVYGGDLGDEPVAAPWNIDQIAMAVESIAQGPTERSDVYRKIARLDKQIGPHASHEFLSGYEFAMTFDQRDKDFDSTTANAQRLFAFKQ